MEMMGKILDWPSGRKKLRQPLTLTVGQFGKVGQFGQFGQFGQLINVDWKFYFSRQNCKHPTLTNSHVR